MTSHTEAREAIKNVIYDCCMSYHNGTGMGLDRGTVAILAHLGELGYGDIDQMSRIATSEHFADLHKFKERLVSEEAVEAAVQKRMAIYRDAPGGTVLLEMDVTRAAIAAAIAKAASNSSTLV